MSPYLVALVCVLSAIGAANVLLLMLFTVDTALTRWSVQREARTHSKVERVPAVDPLLPSEREALDLAEYRRSRVIPIGRAS